MIIAIDFDGTCVTHDFPRIGKDIGAVPVLKRIVAAGHNLILYTMRSDGQKSGDVLAEAVRWFADNEIPLAGINENRQQKHWTTSPKVYAEMYIDDSAFGCPLKVDRSLSNRPFVDWEEVEMQLETLEII